MSHLPDCPQQEIILEFIQEEFRSLRLIKKCLTRCAVSVQLCGKKILGNDTIQNCYFIGLYVAASDTVRVTIVPASSHQRSLAF